MGALGVLANAVYKIGGSMLIGDYYLTVVMAEVSKIIDLFTLKKGMPGLTSACGISLAESAAVCLENQNHRTGVTLRLTGLNAESVKIKWLPVDQQQRRCYNDLQEATERGAYGVAILLVKRLTGKVVLERSKKGPGFDYWIGNRKQGDNSLFSGKARLEVSGILVGSDSELNVRIRQKKAQLTPSDRLATGYVAVVEFGKPAACVEMK
jgi:hypothetical protein